MAKKKAARTKKTAATKRAAAPRKPARTVGADDYPWLEITAQQQLRDWLEKHHATSTGIWLVTWKKATPEKYVDYAAFVDELICFGWIDSKSGSVDADRTRRLCTPRKPTSTWSGPNKRRVARLQKQGRIAPAGQAMIDLAKNTGTWTALDEVENLVVPADLQAAFDQHPPAADNFDAFPRSAKRNILEWIRQAKRPETRTKRIVETATLAAKNERANEWRPRNS